MGEGLPEECSRQTRSRMIKKKDFLKEYNIDKETFVQAGMKWAELNAIYDSYCAIEGRLKSIGREFVNDYLYDIDRAGIHSYRYRTKKPGHLLEKIIRKRSESPEEYQHIDRKNYYKYMTDLIGIRVFFLYREDWIHFHNYIVSQFENNPELYIDDRLEDFDEDPEHFYIAEKPKVYRRTGDTRIYDKKQIDIKSDGIYRSLHYIIKYKGYYIEIQGRTLFEEGWSEIDHDIVYPYFMDDEMLSDFSTLLNRLAGMADEMSSYFRRIKQMKLEEEQGPGILRQAGTADLEAMAEKALDTETVTKKKKASRPGTEAVKEADQEGKRTAKKGRKNKEKQEQGG